MSQVCFRKEERLTTEVGECTLKFLKPSGSARTACFYKLTLCILPTVGVFVFLMALKINSDCFTKQH
jgi:hypothetical protein